jgi:arylsulfatase A-like enzyme
MKVPLGVNVGLTVIAIFSLEALGWRLSGRPGEELLLLPWILAAGLSAGLVATLVASIGARRWSWLAAAPAAFLSIGHAIDMHVPGRWAFIAAPPLGILATLALFRLVSLRRGFAVGIALLAGALLPSLLGRSATRPRRARSGSLPNIILLVMDTTRRDHLSLYGYPRPTSPRLAQFASGAEVYDDAWSVAPWTPASHASIFTGRLPAEHGVDGEDPVPFEAPTSTLAEVLGAAGYATAGFVSNPNLLPKGWDRGFQEYRPPWLRGRDSIAWLLNRWWLGEDDVWGPRPRTTTRNLDLARGWWRRHSGTARFLFLNLMDPHRPYDPPDDMYAQFLPGVPRREAMAVDQDPDRYTMKPGVTGREAELIRGLYDGEIAAMDREIGHFLDWLRVRGDLDGTIVAITADHGERLGERGLIGHESIGDQSIDEYLLQVPLLIRFPRAAPARRIPDRVRLDGLAGHLLRLAGLSVPEAMEPRPWGGELSGLAVAQVERQVWIVRRLAPHGWSPDGPLKVSDRSFVADQEFALSCPNGAEETARCRLHALSGDPEWREDLSAEHPGEVSRLGAVARSLPRFKDRPATIKDPEVLERLKALGYVQ